MVYGWSQEMGQTLKEIVGQAQRGDEDAFTELVHLYQRPVLRVAWQILGTRDDAEDAAQDAWLIASRKIASLHDAERFGGWLYRIAANAALRKRQQRCSQNEKLGSFMRLAGDVLATSERTRIAGEEEAIIGNGRADMLPAAIASLSHRDRLAVILHYQANMDIAQIAHLVGIPAGTVKSRLSHARAKLRKEIIAMTQQGKRPEHIPADFREVIADGHGDMPWSPLFTGDFSDWRLLEEPASERGLQSSGLPPYWQVAGNGLIGQNPPGSDGTCLAIGDETWRNYEVSMLITPIWGGNAQFFFRINGEPGRNSFYAIDMMLGLKTINVHKIEPAEQGNGQITCLSAVNYPVECQREYSLSIAARGQSITTYVDGALLNQVTDGSFQSGGIGLNVWQSRTMYRDLRVRLYR